MRYLGVDCSPYGVRAVLTEADGTVVARGAARLKDGLEPALLAAVEPCLQGELEMAVAVPGCNHAVFEPLLQRVKSVWVAHPHEALLCGALGCRPGLVLQAGSVARVHGVDQTGKLRSLEQDTGSAEWLVTQALEGASASPRLKAAVDQHHQEHTPLAFCQQVLELASFPGPEPHCRALVRKAARSLSDLVRHLMPRLLVREPPRASWTGVALREPLLEEFQSEVFRYHPQLRWAPPRFGPEVGSALLALAGFQERERRGDFECTVRRVGPDVWRYVYRMAKPFPGYAG